MTPRRFLAALALGVILWLGGFLAFSWLINPYGVSPVHVSWSRINEHKPKRRGIDRYIKPYEVWDYQPRTVFIGSSRILEAINTAQLDGTRYAPAYNAAVSGSTMDLDASLLEQYIRLDRSLKFVFVELFVWSLVLPQRDLPQQDIGDFLKNSAALHLSGRAVWDAVMTVKLNWKNRLPQQYVDSRGNMITVPDWNAKTHFDAYSKFIMGVHKEKLDIRLHEKAFQAMDRMVSICRNNGLELYFVVMPNHPYDDYRIRSLGYWDLLEQWQRRIAEYPNVLSLAQYTAPLVEPISERMTYWYDPIHPSMKFGDLALRAFKGERSSDIPPDILRPLNPDTVEDILLKRREGLERWIGENQQYADAFEKAKIAAGVGHQ